jgi:hypothetical protein
MKINLGSQKNISLKRQDATTQRDAKSCVSAMETFWRSLSRGTRGDFSSKIFFAGNNN